nr:hypothetical protein [Helicobacter pylori]
MDLVEAKIPYIAIENPIGIMNTRYKKPNQIVQPYHFGDSASKKTCLWLKNLPPLKYTNIVDPGEFIEFKSGKKIVKWYSDGLTKTKSAKERQIWRSKTFPGFAKVMAEQWGEFVKNEMFKKVKNESLFKEN